LESNRFICFLSQAELPVQVYVAANHLAQADNSANAVVGQASFLTILHGAALILDCRLVKMIDCGEGVENLEQFLQHADTDQAFSETFYVLKAGMRVLTPAGTVAFVIGVTLDKEEDDDREDEFDEHYVVYS